MESTPQREQAISAIPEEKLKKRCDAPPLRCDDDNNGLELGKTSSLVGAHTASSSPCFSLDGRAITRVALARRERRDGRRFTAKTCERGKTIVRSPASLAFHEQASERSTRSCMIRLFARVGQDAPARRRATLWRAWMLHSVSQGTARGVFRSITGVTQN